MIKNTTKLLLASTLLASTLSATDTLTQINFEQKDGNLNPDIFIPIYWTDTLYSGTGYTSSSSKEISKIDSFSDSKSGVVSSSSDARLNWLTKKIGNFSIGLETNVIRVNNNEFGYIHDSNDLFGNGSDYYIAFDNDIELKIIKTGIYTDYSTNFNNLGLRISASLFPSTSLEVEQSTLFKPLVNSTGTNSSTTSQELGYNLKIESFYDTGSFLKLGFLYSYDYSPIKYDIAQLAVDDANNYLFEDTTIDTDEITTKYLLKLYIDKKMLGGLTPTIGFGSIKTELKNNKTNKTTKEDESIVSFGFERRF